ncbi:MAG: CHAT domain-containing protein, partial [Bacteroidota bacterium]
MAKDQLKYDEANAMATYLAAADFLADYLDNERPQAPQTAALTELYHKVALWYYRALEFGNALTYVDATITLRLNTPEVSLTDLARSEVLKAEILKELSIYRPAANWFSRSLNTLRQAMAAGDSLGTNLFRIQYYTSRSASSAAFLFDLEYAGLLLEQFPALMEKGKESLSEVQIRGTKLSYLNTKGIYLQKQGKYALAEAAYRQILTPEFTDYPRVRSSVAIARNNLGHSLFTAGKYSEATRSVREAISEFEQIASEKGGYQDNLASSYGYLLMIQWKTEQYEQVDSTLARGLEYARRAFPSGKGRNFGTLYTYAALAKAGAGDFAAADSLFLLGAETLMDEYTPAGPAQLPIIANRAIYAQEEMLELLEGRRDAYRTAFAAGDPEGLEKALLTSQTLDTLLRRGRQQLSLTASVGQFIQIEKRHTKAAIDIALQLYRLRGEEQSLRTAYEFVAGQKSNLLRQYLTSPNLAQSLGVPQSVIDEKTDLELRVLIAEKALSDAEEGRQPELRAEVLRLNQELNELRNQLATDYPAFTRALRGYAPVDIDAAAASLTTDQLVVEYFTVEDSVYAFTISNAAGLSYQVLPRPENLVDDIQEVVEGGAAAGALFAQLVEPLLIEGTTRLQFIPDGDLWRLPFAALKTNDERFLIQDYAISYTYAAPLLFDPALTRVTSRAEDVFQGYGIDYTDVLNKINASDQRSLTDEQLRDMGQLPFAGKEVIAAAEIIGGQSWLNEKATKDFFLRDAPQAGIIHVSMHGLLASNPLESALVFRGNDTDVTYDLLRMSEVLGGHFPAELTVLSACHTGNGTLETAEGKHSIGRAFTAAGSRSTITSSWEASDEATHDILTAFYRYLKAGDTRDVALQNSIIEYLQTGSAAD